VALGMTSLILVLAARREWLRWAGVAYLIWLGIQQWRAAADACGERANRAHCPYRRARGVRLGRSRGGARVPHDRAPGLGDRPPIEVAVDDFGARHVEEILHGILHGLPA
jgi:hypothetical protein